jgi:hypothetical protein
VAEDTPEPTLTGVLSTEPFVLDRPFTRIKRAKIAVTLFILALIVVPSVSAWVGYELGAQRTNAQIAVLNADRASAHAGIVKAQQSTAAREERDREVLCALLERDQQDPTITKWRKQYQCGPVVKPSTAAGPKPTAGPTLGALGRQPLPVPAPQPTPTAAPAPHPAPHPTPTGNPPTLAPTPPPVIVSPPHLVCLLGICLL